MKTKIFSLVALMGIALISSSTTLPVFAKEQERASHTVSVVAQTGDGVHARANIHAHIAVQNLGDRNDHKNNGASVYSPGHLKKISNNNQWQWQYENQNNNSSSSSNRNDVYENEGHSNHADWNWNWQQCLTTDSIPCWYTFNNNATTTSIIGSVAITHITPSSATITWMTNNLSGSSISYSTSSPVTSASLTASSSAMTRYHSLTLQNLTPQTTYYFVVSSTNTLGSTTTSSQYTFTTATSALTVPIISSIEITNTSTTSVTLHWITTTHTTGTAWYSTSHPVNATSSTLNASSSALDTTHTLTLNGLTAATTYYGIITATDAGGNSTTSNEFSFVTQAPIGTTNLNATTTAQISWLTNIWLSEKDSK